MTEWEAVALAFLFIEFVILGAFLRNDAWASNAMQPQRMLYSGRFYKVVELGNAESMRCLEIHIKEVNDAEPRKDHQVPDRQVDGGKTGEAEDDSGGHRQADID